MSLPLPWAASASSLVVKHYGGEATHGWGSIAWLVSSGIPDDMCIGLWCGCVRTDVVYGALGDSGTWSSQMRLWKSKLCGLNNLYIYRIILVAVSSPSRETISRWRFRKYRTCPKLWSVRSCKHIKAEPFSVSRLNFSPHLFSSTPLVPLGPPAYSRWSIHALCTAPHYDGHCWMLRHQPVNICC